MDGVEQVMTDASKHLVTRIAVQPFAPRVPFDDAVIQIPREDRFVRELDESARERELGLELFVRGDVARNLRHPDENTSWRANRRGDHRDVNTRAPFSLAYRVVMTNSLTGMNPSLYVALFRTAVVGDNQVNRLP
jgi:hypothetical protein